MTWLCNDWERFHPRVTDIVTTPPVRALPSGRTPAETSRARITGFYKLTGFPDNPRLTSCRATDPAMVAIDTYAVSGRIWKAWELTWQGPVPWNGDLIASELKNWEAGLSSPFSFSLREYPRLVEPFLHMSLHEQIRMERWKRDTAQAIEAWASAAA